MFIKEVISLLAILIFKGSNPGHLGQAEQL
jgi:hypothetical protein